MNYNNTNTHTLSFGWIGSQSVVQLVCPLTLLFIVLNYSFNITKAIYFTLTLDKIITTTELITTQAQ